MSTFRRRIRRRLQRSLVAAGLVALLGAIWFFFLPVPLTWAARLALRITLPSSGDHARVRMDRVTFRFGFIQPSVRIDLYGIVVEGASGGQLARNIDQVEVRFAKKALWRRNWAPSLIEVFRPVLVIDLTKPGVAPLPPPALVATSASPSASLAVRTATLRAFIPLPDNPCRFVIKEPSVDVKTPGRDIHWLFQDIDTVFSRQKDNLRFEFPIVLANTRRPVGLTCRIDGAIQTGLISFTARLAKFSSEDLPPLPLLPGESERSRFQVAFDLEGKLRLDQLRLEEINVRFLADEGEFHLPKIKSAPIHVRRLELRGGARDDFRFIHLDAAILAVDSLRLDASGLDAETGPSPRLSARVVIAGPTGADIAAYLPAATLASLPFSADALREIRIESVNIDVKGSARVGTDGRLAAQTLAFDGRVNLDLNGENIPIAVNASADGAGQPIRAHFRAPEINLARLRLAALKPYAFLAALDFPVSLNADATATDRGELRTASLHLRVGSGRLRAFGLVPSDLALKSATLNADASDGGRTIHVADLRLELDGPILSITDLTTRFSPTGVVSAQGRTEIENVSGEYLVKLGQDAMFTAFAPFGLHPNDLRIAKLAGSFSAKAVPTAKNVWPTVAATFDETTDLVVQGEPLGLHVNGKIDGAADLIDADVAVAEFRPARFRLRLPGNLSSTAFDFPAKLHAQVVGGLQPHLRSVTGSLAIGPGVLHANPYFDGELPVTAFSLEASLDDSLKNAEMRALRADLAGLVVRADGVKFRGGAKPVVSGALELEGATIDRILRVWPASLQSALRRQVAAMVKAGEVTRADLRFAVPLDLERPADTRPTELVGDVLLNGLRLETPYKVGPIALDNLAIAVKYPGGAATLAHLAASGITLTNATVRTADVFAPAVQVAVASAFTADLSKTSAWLQTLGIALPPDVPVSLAKLAGTASGDFRATLPMAASIELDTLEATLQARIDGLVVPLAAPGARFGGGQLVLSAHSLRGQFSTVIDWQEVDLKLPDVISGRLALHVDATIPPTNEFDLHATIVAHQATSILKGPSLPSPLAPLTIDAHIAGWRNQPKISAQIRASSPDFLGGPLAVAARATMTSSNRRVETASISSFQLGRTNLGVEFSSPASGRYALEVKGPQLDVAGLLRLAAPFVTGSPVSPAGRGTAAVTSTTQKLSAPMAVATPTVPVERAKAPPLFENLKVSVEIDSVDFGGGRKVRDFSLSTRIVDDLPREFSLEARENRTNALSFAVTPKGDHQRVTLTIADATAWLQLLTQPFRQVELPLNTATALAGTVGQIPILFSGGRFELGGDLRLRTPARLFDGEFKLTDTVIHQAPRVLQLVALKSGKRLRENPIIKEFSAGRLFISNTLVALEGIKSDAASLAYLKLNFIRYGLADEALHLDGQYVGIGFEVLGTRAEPQVFLKDNLLIRAIGSQPEFAFGNAPVAAPPPPPKQD